MYIILSGKVASFIPKDEKLLETENNLDPYTSSEDDLLLKKDFHFKNIYFIHNKCKYVRSKDFYSGETFGVYTPYYLSTFLSLENTVLLQISSKKF